MVQHIEKSKFMHPHDIARGFCLVTAVTVQKLLGERQFNIAMRLNGLRPSGYNYRRPNLVLIDNFDTDIAIMWNGHCKNFMLVNSATDGTRTFELLIKRLKNN